MVAPTESQKTISRFANRYELYEQIGHGGMGVVYRALDRLRGKVVAVKRVYWNEKPYWSRQASLFSTGNDLTLALAHEFRILASLRHPNIISVLDYGFDSERQPYFTMDVLESAKTIVEAGSGQPISIQIELLIQLLRALDYLHRRHIIHCDLKPSNVLVVDGQVKVLDFGLSTSVGETRATSGSLPYMAPELFDDVPPSVASDLYAVGVILFEMLTGTLPFSNDDIDEAIEAIQQQKPDLSQVDDFICVLSGLLAKQPDQRPVSAREVIGELGNLLTIPLPVETAEIRESFLQAAQFIGRETEMSTLTEALNGARNGQGSVWLIAGESGVGKSRLLDELQVLALVDGTLVVRGQTVNQGSSPYQMWRPVLRWLCLLAELTDFEASVFKPLITDIETLLKRSIPDAAEADPQTVQHRLLTVIENILSRQTQPIVILLEDVQWAGDESLTILARLIKLIGCLPVLILASFRDDDRPRLPDLLPEANLLSLNRFSEEATARLTSAILGIEVIPPSLPRLLYRETEGNIFFLIEVMRSLTATEGQLATIDTVSFPKHIFTDGIHSFMRQRLNRVQAPYQKLLKLAAINGRQLNLQILQQLDPLMNLQSWLDNCVNVAVLEFRDDTWRFTHDKLRDELIQSISGLERRAMHGQVAEVLEVMYSDTEDFAAPLAYQWGEAGNLTKEFKYLLRAGEYAQRSGANQSAAEYLDKAALVSKQLPIPEHELAEVERLRGEAYLALGNLRTSVVYMKNALKLLKCPYPTNRLLLFSCLRAIIIQVSHLLNLEKSINRKNILDYQNYQLKIAQVYLRLAFYYYFTVDFVPAFHAAVNSLNYAERSGLNSPTLAESYANAAIASSVIGLPKLADRYFQQAEIIAQAVNQPRFWASLSQRQVTYELGRSNWKKAEQHARDGIAIAQVLGDERLLREIHMVKFFSHYFQGDFEQAKATLEQIRSSAMKEHDVQSLLYSASFGSAMTIRAGKYEEAIAALTEFTDMNAPSIPASERARILNVFGQLGLAYFYCSKYDQAYQALEFVVNMLASAAAPETSYVLVLGYTAGLEACLGLRERAVGDSGTLQAMADVLINGFRVFAKRFELGRPALLRLEGLQQWLNGNQFQAERLWTQALNTALKLSMPLEQGLTLVEIGRHSGHEAARDAYLSRAMEIFDKLGLPFAPERYSGENHMTNQAENTAQAGVRIYSDFTLKFYDLLILGVSNRLAWQCPSSRILDFYDRNISANHLDVGVGTGYFLDKCRFPTAQPQISLMDLNPTSLKVTAKRLEHYHPATYVANILEPFQMSLPKFDSIGLSYLIHCLPGSMSEKSAIFKHLKTLLNPGGTLFGTTILGKGTQHNLFAKVLIGFYNKLGVFGNANDTLADLEQALRQNFSTYSLTTVGCVAFFTAKA